MTKKYLLGYLNNYLAAKKNWIFGGVNADGFVKTKLFRGLNKKTGLTIDVKPAMTADLGNSILFRFERHAPERYVLYVSGDSVEVVAYTPQGAFNAAVICSSVTI